MAAIGLPACSQAGPSLFHTGNAEQHESLWPGVWKLSLWPGRGGFVITELLGIGLLTGEACGGEGADCQKDYPPPPHHLLLPRQLLPRLH